MSAPPSSSLWALVLFLIAKASLSIPSLLMNKKRRLLHRRELNTQDFFLQSATNLVLSLGLHTAPNINVLTLENILEYLNQCPTVYVNLVENIFVEHFTDTFSKMKHEYCFDALHFSGSNAHTWNHLIQINSQE